MDRRKFIKNFSLAATPLALGGIPIRAMGRSIMTSSFTCDDVNDRVMVIIQMHGGNDGLNMLIPIDQYATYKNLRPVIGVEDTGVRKYITLDNNLPSNQQIGLHPDMQGVKSLYDEGKVHMVNNVAYTNMNGSHFRGTDIWLTGKDGNSYDETDKSGWWGRYLDHRFDDFPNSYPNTDMPDPPGIEFGSHIISLGFHRATGIPMGVTLGNDPSNFANSVNGVGGALPGNFPNTDYGRELEYIVEIERTTNQYAQRIQDVYNQGTNTPGVVYPEKYHTNAARFNDNRLAPQLKTVARLLSGGIKTKVFLVRIGGFDTHENQAIAGKPSFGGHGCLMYHVSEAMKAFQADLAGLGLEDKVLTVTFSEFGRQVAENGTYGTDHGSSAPMMIFGKGLKGGVSGVNPNLSNLNNNKLVGYDKDYRQVFATVLQDWFGANYGTLDEVEIYDYAADKLDLINDNYIDNTGTSIDYRADITCDPTPDIGPPAGGGGGGTGGGGGGTGGGGGMSTAIGLSTIEEEGFQIYPNPASVSTTVSLEVEGMTPASLQVYTLNGKRVMEEPMRLFAGENETQLDVSTLESGTYVIQAVANPGSPSGAALLASKRLVVSH